jgi:phosphoribosylanthranilate isomerase
MSVQIKICGLSTPETVDAAIEAGATHIGLVHYEPSPRHVALDQARELRERARGKAKAVLLLVNADPELTGRALNAIQPDVIQFHGSETPQWIGGIRRSLSYEVWKAVGLKDAGTLTRSEKYIGMVDRLLFDAPAKKLPGGNGTAFDWSLLAGHNHQIGLTADNVAEAIRATQAPLVDTSSGVESAPGVKDPQRIADFCRAVRSA